jgi:rSAM/selenodomain-associated transferase 1
MRSICLVQFAKLPELGRVKTRMQPFLSEAESLDLHKGLVLHTFAELSDCFGVDYQLWFDEKISESQDINMFLAPILAENTHIKKQRGSDLGDRMRHCFEALLQDYDAVILVGSDCPFIDKKTIESVVDLTKNNECVLVPALDGGYALIALTKSCEQLFKGISWGSSKVFAETESALIGACYRYALLSPLADIDRPEDLETLMRMNGGAQLLTDTVVKKLSQF